MLLKQEGRESTNYVSVDQHIMAKNFKIIKHRQNKCLHLKLKGDFDGNSAFELINTLKETANVPKIYIHAESLKSVDPFGSEVFEKHFFEIKGNADKIFIIRSKS